MAGDTRESIVVEIVAIGGIEMPRSKSDYHAALVKRTTALEKNITIADESLIDETDLNLDLLTDLQKKMILVRPWCASDSMAAERIGKDSIWVRDNKRRYPEFARALEIRAAQLPRIIRNVSAQLMSKNLLLLAEATEVNEIGEPKHGWSVFFRAQEETRRIVQTESKDKPAPVVQAVQMFSYGNRSDN